jgi:hypothetical protein
MTWRDHLPIHPVCNKLPPMSPEKLRALAEDIKEHGLRDPVDVAIDRDGSMVLIDGRNRLNALELLGKSFDELGGYIQEARPGEILNDAWVVPYIVSKNYHRRHLDLTNKQTRELIDDLLKADPTQSDRQIAKTVKRNHETVGGARAKLEARGEIRHVETRTDTKGRKQKSHRAKATSEQKPLSAAERRFARAAGFTLSEFARAKQGANLPRLSSRPSKGDLRNYTEQIEKYLRAAPAPAPNQDTTAPADRSPPTAPMIALAPAAPAEAAVPVDDAAQLNELPSEQQDGILHLMLKLLVSLDHKHRKKFHKHFTDYSFDGVYIPSCGNRGWASGRYVVDDAVVKLVVAKLLACNGLPACSIAAPAAPKSAKSPAPRKLRTDKAEQRDIAAAIAADPSASDAQISERLSSSTMAVAFVRNNMAPTTRSAAADPYADRRQVVLPEHEQEEA